MTVIDVESDPFDATPSSSVRMDVEPPQTPHANGAAEAGAGLQPRDDRLLFGLLTGDLVIVGVAMVFAVMFVPVTMFPSWTPRMSLLLAVLPAGMVALGVLVARRSRSGIAAAALLTWCLVASFFTDDVRGSIVGMVGRELSFVILAGSIGMWALGRHLTDRGRDRLPWALLAALSVSLLVGVLQVVLALESGSLPLSDGRATGLTPHPVTFGALMAAGAALSASLLNRFPSPALGVFAVGAFTVGVSLSGSRIALVAVVVLIAWTMARSAGFARWFLPLPVVLGTVLGPLVARPTSRGASSDAATRFGSQTGLSERIDLWGYSLSAFGERPIQGWGLGRFRPAVQGRYQPEFAPQDVPGNAWFDAHNVVVTVFVAAGLVGALAVAAFVVLAGVRARGPLAAGAVAITITWFLQPTTLTTLPLVMLMLGAAFAAPAGAATQRATRVAPTYVWSIAAGLGVVLGGLLLAGDIRVHDAANPPDAPALEGASSWMLPDPSVADLVTQAWTFEVIAGADHEADALRWAERATELEPDRPRWWNRLAGLQLAFGRLDEARVSIDRTLELQPWDLQAWEMMGYYAEQIGDEALAEQARTAICAVRPASCVESP